MAQDDQRPSVSSVMLAALGDWSKVAQFCLMIVCRYLPRCLICAFAVYMLGMHGSEQGERDVGQILSHSVDPIMPMSGVKLNHHVIAHLPAHVL